MFAPEKFQWGFFMVISEDIKFMNRAVKLSKKGFGFVNPNPLVGAVIVKNGKIIGEGYHEKFGGPHAEIVAISSASESVKGATMYVTVEPCNHQGKTPPCTDRIIMEKFDRVVIGMKDPNKNVRGNGVQRLKQTGINVEYGVLEDEVQKVNEVFIKYITSGIPFCALKTAMTLDGKISTYTGDSKWISNEKSRQWVHELRHMYSAIMVGVNTVITDNPQLTDRSSHSFKSNPIRIIVDSNGRTPLNSKVLNTNSAKTIVAVTKNATKEFIAKVNDKGAEVIVCPLNQNKVNISFLIKELGNRGIDSILLEGGSTLNFSALKEKIVDKVYSFISPKLLGGEKANTPVGGIGFKKVNNAITLNISSIIRFDEDLMIEAYIPS
ncbi:MAG: bifunctional diaminohydroxyphosphoribosylaminopyrimidine deaminase/5-amino-6-(5-phosphoribosylamino)uracil reductase RibD [Bacteroidales bacterium]